MKTVAAERLGAKRHVIWTFLRVSRLWNEEKKILCDDDADNFEFLWKKIFCDITQVSTHFSHISSGAASGGKIDFVYSIMKTMKT